MVAAVIDSPYVGAHSFTKEDRHRFFGRERDLRDLGRLLIAERIVLLYSPSGAGKSSLLQAGLAPALANDNFVVHPIMRVHNELPEGHTGTPNRFLYSAVSYLHSELPDDRQAELDPASMEDLTFSGYLDLIAGPDGEETNEVLIFDQFEEILKIDPGSRAAHRERTEFFRQVGEALASRRRWAVFSIREDYLAGLDPYRRFIPTRLTTRFRLDLLRVEDARRAISLPPQDPAFNVTIADDAVDQLLSDLGGAANLGTESITLPGQIDDALYIEPLHLQIVCDRLWQKVQPVAGDVITLKHLGTSSDVDSALRGFYDDTVARVAAKTGTDERSIRDWFQEELILGKEGMRGQVIRGEHRSGSLDTDTADALVEAKVVNRELRLNTDRFELSHDRLIPAVRSSNTDWYQRHLTEFQHKARTSEEQGRPNRELLSPREWLQATQHAQRPGIHLREYEQRFLDVSAASFKRNALYAGAFLAVLVVAIFAFSIFRENEAEQRSRELASQAAINLPGAHANSLEWSLLYAVAAVGAVNNGDPPPEAHSSLLSSLVARPGYAGPMVLPDGTIPDQADQSRVTLLGQAGNLPDTLASSPDGRVLASIDDEGLVTIIYTPEPPQVGTTIARPAQHTFSLDTDRGDVVALAFLDKADYEDGLLIAGRRDGTLEVWDIGTGLQIDVPFADPQVSRSPTVELSSLDANSFGFIAAGFTDGTITIWGLQDLSRPTELQTLGSPGRDRIQVTALAFEPWLQPSFRDQASIAARVISWRVIAGYSNGEVWRWAGVLANKPTNDHLHTLPSGTPVLTIAPNQQSGWLAFGGEDGFVIWQNSDTVIPLTATSTVTAIAFDPLQSHALLTGHMDGQVLRWTFVTESISASTTTTSIRLSEATGSPITDLVAVPRGHWVVATSGNTAAPTLWNALGLPSIAYAVNDRVANLPTCSVEVAFTENATLLVIRGENGSSVEWPLDEVVPGSASTATSTNPALTPQSSLRTDSLTCTKQGPLGSGSGDMQIPIVDRHGNVWVSNVHDALGERASQPDAIVTSIVNDDRTLIATGHADGVIRLWLLVDNEWWRLGDLPGHTQAIKSLSMSLSDRPYLASLDANGLVVVWDLDFDKGHPRVLASGLQV